MIVIRQVRVCVCVKRLNRRKTSTLAWLYSFGYVITYEFTSAGGTGVTLVPVPTKTARCHSDIKGRRPFDVPAIHGISDCVARG